MKLIGDVVMWNLILVLLEIVLVSVQDECMVRTKCTIGSEIVWMHPMLLLGDEAQVKLVLVQSEIVVILFSPNVPWAQKSFWTRPMNFLGDVGRVESCFGPFEDSISVGAS
jgi:hypothetical protein